MGRNLGITIKQLKNYFVVLFNLEKSYKSRTESSHTQLCNLPLTLTLQYDDQNQGNNLSTMLQVLFKFHHFPHLCPLSIPGSNPGSPTAFRFLVSSVLWSIALPQFLFVFHDLNIFEEYWSLFCRMFLNLGLSDVFSWLDRGFLFLAERSQKRCRCVLMNTLSTTSGLLT